jgi:glyoxylase-like metal-dependent hydrolase (beta-lactamase superfamily II)
MRVVVPPFHRFMSLFVSNVYLLDGGPGDRWLIDTGHWTERLQLLAELRRTGFRPSDLTGVLLTHRHSDHAGNAAFLRREFGVKIYAHRADAEVLEGAAPRATMGGKGSLFERALCAVENRWPARVQVERALDAGDSIASLEVHHVPGHTEGSVFYRHAGTQCLLTGDTLLTARPPLALVMDFVPPYDAYSLDLAQAHGSLDAFHAAGFPYQHVLAGHGQPLIGDARARILRAMERMPRAISAGGTRPHAV